MYNLFSFLKNLRIWHCYQSCSFVYNSAILLQLVIHWWIFIFPAHIAMKDESKDGIMDSFSRCTKNGNREESFKTNRAIFYFPFGAPPVFPLDTIRIKQTDPLLRRNEKLIRKGGGHNRLSFIARIVKRRGIVNAILGRNITPSSKLFRSSKLFDSEDNKIFSKNFSLSCYIFRGSSIRSWIFSSSMIIIFRNCNNWNLESIFVINKIIVHCDFDICGSGYF